MIKTLLVLICSINILSVTSALASSSSKPLKGLLQNSVEKDYTDFSGTWEMENTYRDGQGYRVTIENDGSYFIMDSQVVEIGKMVTEAESINDKELFRTPGSSISSIEWNSDRTALIVRTVSASKPTGESPMSFGVSYKTLSLNQKGQLELKEKGVRYENLKKDPQLSPNTYVFNKVSEPNPSKKTKTINLFGK